ncbi:hypothetical protein [Burkholderia cenocepacia]|jgi:hypothetical protein|uniref:Uncharacterized protein n=1 Tax=Dechloromonas agitata TaxID=73030 RepID=A0A930BVQ0_9RHOO|nr:hypothetical protein [Burkholderia cenocepacia]MBF1166086.1 hypothetical protein [Dechloromonas agitata]MDI9690140.1 hypothetical protein [Burkholderia cenocepacia]
MKQLHIGQIGFYMPDLSGGKSPLVVLKTDLPPLEGAVPADTQARFEAYCPQQDIVLTFSHADFGTIEDARNHATAFLDRVLTIPEYLPLAQGHLAALAEAVSLAEKVPEILRKHGVPEGPMPIGSNAAPPMALTSRPPYQSPYETSVQVKHWEAYGIEGTGNTHQFDIDDQRSGSGQAYVTVGALEGDLDDMLSVTMEVGTNPLNGLDQVACAHVHFDGDSLAMSLFKIGDKILMRPETDVSIRPFYQEVNGRSEQLYWID